MFLNLERTPAMSSESSDVERIERDGRSVYVKHFRTGPRSDADVVRDRIHREVELLAHLHRNWSDASVRLGMIECVEFDAERLRLTLAEAPGELVQQRLFRQANWRGRPLSPAPALLAGRWLSAFQSRGPSSDALPIKEDAPHRLIEYCGRRLDRLAATEPGWMTDRRRERILVALATLLDRAPAADRRIVCAHGDFHTGNILWDGRTVTPIDFAMCGPDLPLADISFFVHRLEMVRWQFPWGRWPVRQFTRAIFRGYGQPDGEGSAIFQVLMIRQTLNRLVKLSGAAPRLAPRLHNAWLKRRVRSRLAGLLSAAE